MEKCFHGDVEPMGCWGMGMKRTMNSLVALTHCVVRRLWEWQAGVLILVFGLLKEEFIPGAVAEVFSSSSSSFPSLLLSIATLYYDYYYYLLLFIIKDINKLLLLLLLFKLLMIIIIINNVLTWIANRISIGT